MSQLRDYAARFRAQGARILAVSVDSHRAHEGYAAHLDLDFPLLSDFHREVVVAYDVQHSEWQGMRGMAKRSLFVIDQQGTIRYRWVSEDPTIVPDLEEALAVVRELSEDRGAG